MLVGAGGWRRFAHSMLKTRHAITMRKTVLNGDMRAKERTLKPTSQLTGKRHMPVSCPLSGTTPSLEELETDLTLSPLSRGPEPWGWTGRCPGIPVPSLTRRRGDRLPAAAGLAGQSEEPRSCHRHRLQGDPRRPGPGGCPQDAGHHPQGQPAGSRSPRGQAVQLYRPQVGG